MRTHDNFSWRPERSMTSRGVTSMVVAVTFAGLGFWLSRSVPEADRVVAEPPDKQVAQRLEANPSTVAEMPIKSAPLPLQADPPVILLKSAGHNDRPALRAAGRETSVRTEERQGKRPANYEALRDEMLAER
jgi:hypothetical protein